MPVNCIEFKAGHRDLCSRSPGGRIRIPGSRRPSPADHAHIAQGASFPRIHTFLATSDIHMKHKVRARLPSACLHGRWALLIRALSLPAPQDAGGGPGDDSGDEPQDGVRLQCRHRAIQWFQVGISSFACFGPHHDLVGGSLH